MKRGITVCYRERKKCHFSLIWVVIFMSVNPQPFKAGPWKHKCLERPFSEAQGLSLPGFCVVEKSSDGRGNASAFSFNRSHIFLNERPFATRLQSCFSERAVCPLASDISYRQAGEGEKERTNEKQHIDNRLSPFFPHLTFSSHYGASIPLRSFSFRGRVSIYQCFRYPSIHLKYLSRN